MRSRSNWALAAPAPIRFNQPHSGLFLNSKRAVLQFTIQILILHMIAHASTKSSQAAELPAAAHAVINALPKKTLTLDYVLKESMRSADSFRALNSARQSFTSEELKNKSITETYFKLSASKLNNQNEALSTFSTNRTISTAATLSAESYFRSGTALLAEVKYGKTELYYPATLVSATDTKYFDTEISLTLKQNIWKDFFGFATRKSIAAGEASTQIKTLEFFENRESWFFDIHKIYSDVWLMQQRSKAAESNLGRRKRLSKITTIRAERGTAEKPDLYQSESAVQESNTAVLESNQGLGSMWRSLIITLGLPSEWESIDPNVIPVEYLPPIDRALELCGSESAVADPPLESVSTLKIQFQSQAARYQYEASKNRLNPDLNLQFNYTVNGLDTANVSDAISDTTGRKFPSWLAGIELKIPLNNFESKSQFEVASSQLERAEAMLGQSHAALVVNWKNECHNLFRLKKSIDLRKSSYENQRLRAELEEKRYRLGRVGLTNVIQAGDDASRSELSLRESQSEIDRSSWKILQYSNQINTYLDRIQEELSRQ